MSGATVKATRLLPLVSATSFEGALEREARSRALMAWLLSQEPAPFWALGLPPDASDWPEEWRDNREERAGFIQYLGGLSKGEAEHQAEICVREEYARSLVPPLGSPPVTVFAEAVSLSQSCGPGEARTGGLEREPGDLEGEWALSGS